MKKLIELDATLDALREVIVPEEDIGFGDELTDGYNDGIDMAITVVSGLPTVDAVPVRHGRWNCSDDMYESAVCSCCGWDTAEPWVHIKEWFQFCPHCGARMDGKGNGNETD